LTRAKTTYRDAFGDLELVFDPKSSTWNSLKSCTWAATGIEISSKVSIATTYLTLADFFVRILQVKSPDISMYIDTLRIHAQKAVPFNQTKATILHLMKMNPSEKSLEPVKGLGIWPIRSPPGLIIDNRSSLGEFVIADHEELRKAFEGKLYSLDLTLEELRELRPFLLALGMKNKYLSSRVEEMTDVEDSSLSTNLTKRYRSRAHFLIRFVHWL
jgi:hypothetical protein